MDTLFLLVGGYIACRAIGLLSRITAQIADDLEQIDSDLNTPGETHSQRQ